MTFSDTPRRVPSAYRASGLISRLGVRGAPVLMLPVLLLIPHSVHACATCGCALSSDAAMGYSAIAGWRLSVQYDYIPQDQLRSGTHAVSGVPDGNELEH